MTENGNSVNIGNCGAETRATYHHGDLGTALLDAGMAALDSGSCIDDLSLRGLARAAGVSATAVYRHFPDKQALLGALALAGLDRLAHLQRAAASAAATKGPHAAFLASGGAYVRFALAHPELFRLIWRTAPEGDLLDEPIEQSHDAMIGLRRGIDAVMPADASAEQRRSATLRCWSLVHGLATLALDKQLKLDDAMIDGAICGALDGWVDR
ncbi:MAG: TetR/AcrR family transcriptional regulator [Sphingopyxis sp.]